jgi:hypothetical protein
MRAAEHEGASIVMIGSFNPAIFQPRWLGTQKIIRPEEAANAKITIIQDEVADFSTEWFQLQVLQNRFSVASTDPRSYAPLRDLAASVCDMLPHTPVKALGMNRTFHFKADSVDAWHAIGHKLAPKDLWAAIVDSPGLRSMTMEGRRKGVDAEGRLNIKVEPSARINHGVFVEINEQYSARGADSDHARWVPERLAKYWDAVMSFSEAAAEHLLSMMKV